MAAGASTSTGAFASSSSSSHSTWTYDVFLSFRGEDTRKGFTDHLYHALTDAGLYTFRDDDELRKGEDLSSELLSAIEGSRLSVVIISENYAASRWCLEELEKITECRSMRDQWILPVFYHVDPSDVRKQKGSFVETFAEHEKPYSLDKDKVHRWRAALKEVCNLSGWHLTNNLPEAEVVRGIVRMISAKVNPTMLSVAVYPVGIDPRVGKVTSFLSIEDDAVRMVGIWGMGGVGKTSISKAIHNRFFHSFEAVSFIANIRETCEQPDGQLRLQKQLLYDTLKRRDIEIKSVDNGITVIKRRLCGKKVLVILDDVNHREQVDAMVVSRDCFGPGSKIVITTRDERVLNQLGVDAIYPAEKMNDDEALELFSFHAFKKRCPTEDFMDLSKSVVSYCGGVPLALEVLGSHLSFREIPEWISVLEKLKAIPHEEIQEKLKISFDGLKDNTLKDTFLDIACFFIGMKKYYVTQIMDGCGFHGVIGIKILTEQCLLSVDRGGELTMHDLLRDMGREIVREENHDEPEERSRVWQQEDALEVLKHQGKKAIEGLALKLPSSNHENFDTIAFKEMKRLRLLQLDYVRLIGDYKHLSEKLRWLCWHGFPLKFMPDYFYPRYSVAIDLRHSNLKQVWRTDKQLFNELKFLNLSHSHSLTQTPNFAILPYLEELGLQDCTSLSKVHESIGNLSKLVLVDFEGCKSLKSLPRCLYLRKSLKTFIISGCSKINTLPEEFGELESLTTFLADHISVQQVPFTITKLKELKYLSLGDYTGSPVRLFNSIFWSRISPEGSPSSVNPLHASSQDLNVGRELPASLARLFNSIFWSRISPRGSPSSVNLLPALLQGLNLARELRLRGFNLLNDGILKGLSTLRSLGFLKRQTPSLNYSPRRLPDDNIVNISKQSIFQECNVGLVIGLALFSAAMIFLIASRIRKMEVSYVLKCLVVLILIWKGSSFALYSRRSSWHEKNQFNQEQDSQQATCNN